MLDHHGSWYRIVWADLAPRLAAACVTDGLFYRTHPSLHSAIGSHARWLHTMGRKPTPSRPRPVGL